MGTKKKGYMPGDILSTILPVSTDENTINWLNNQKSISKSIFELIKQYANGELLHIETINKMLSISNSQAINSEEIKKAEVKNNYLIDNEVSSGAEKETRNVQGEKKTSTGIGTKNGHAYEGYDINSHRDKTIKLEDLKEKENHIKKESTIKVPKRKLPFKAAEITMGVDKK